jgi:hypothetical protein
VTGFHAESGQRFIRGTRSSVGGASPETGDEILGADLAAEPDQSEQEARATFRVRSRRVSTPPDSRNSARFSLAQPREERFDSLNLHHLRLIVQTETG